jgi:hypothetical protein
VYDCPRPILAVGCLDPTPKVFRLRLILSSFDQIVPQGTDRSSQDQQLFAKILSAFVNLRIIYVWG